jgi:hypothetical protein
MFQVAHALHASKHYRIKRVDYPFLQYMRSQAWGALHAEMIKFFRQEKPERVSTVSVTAKRWPRFASKEQLLNEALVPAIVWKYGEELKVVFDRKEIESIAFDDVGENSHVSKLFKARLLRVQVESDFTENCVVSDFSAHVNNRELSFVKLARHIPGKVTTVDLPVSLTGLLGCPATLQGAQVDLAMPTIKIECIGPEIPPPLLVDVSGLRFEPPYTRITLGEVEKLLPQDGKTRLSRVYSAKDRHEKEVVMCYEIRGMEEKPLPPGYQDPNFFNRKGKKYHVTYSGFWPRQ